MPSTALLPLPLPPRTFATHLLNVLDCLCGQIGGVDASAFWRALTSLQTQTGQPIEILARLKWSDVDLDRGVVTVPGSDVIRLLPPQLVTALRAIREPERLMVFPWHGGSLGLQHAMNELTARAAVLAERGGGRYDA